MSSCLSGGGRAYRLDLEIIKSPSTSWTSWTSHSSSPSSTLSESSNPPIAIITRKPRTPRKRPNQTYNEAAAILSTAYPKIFSTKQITKSGKFSKPHSTFQYEAQDLLVPFQAQAIDNSGSLLHQPILEKPNNSSESKAANSCEKPCQSPGEINSKENSLDFCDEFQEDFDAESILDEEIEEGIDSIMGNLSVNNDSMEESNACNYNSQMINMNTCYGYPVGLGYGNYFDFGYGLRREAFRNVNDQGDWWRFPSVNVTDLTATFNKIPSEKKKKKVEKLIISKNSESAKESSLSTKANQENSAQKAPKQEPIPQPNSGLLLKLNYDDVLNAWSDRSPPLPDELLGSEASGNDVQTRLAKIDLFSENGGVREARVMRYKEKRRTRLFSKKIRYQVRKVNADQRPRMKGRFSRRPDSPEPENEQG